MRLGTMTSILDLQNGNLLWLILQIGNFLRYNSDILYISLGKVQLCVYGHWIYMQRSYEVGVIITSAFWFNPASSIYVKILWWYFCLQLCLLIDNSRNQIRVYNNYLFLPGHISSIDSKWYTGLPCTHWKHTNLTKFRKYFKLDLRDSKLQQQVQGKSHHEKYFLNTTWTQAWLITRQLIEISAFCWYKIHLDMILHDSSHLEIEIRWIV